MDNYEAKHAGIIPRLFGTCPYCARKATWDLRRKRCIVCEAHGDPTTPLSAPERAKRRELDSYAEAVEPEPLVVVTVHIPVDARPGTQEVFRRDLLTVYGGYNRVTAYGAWRNDVGRTIVEPTNRYEIAMTPGQAQVFCEHRVRLIRTMFGQDALYFTIGGQAFIV
ncbi:hypothetical protein LCGC14_2293790 [marine sediment metagenome]|uniref:Uncharacterized protein n=1 Tax=marine sediment metagenome TaxID=412755 RepID=A0A0F9CQY5_9ZZZZ